MSRDRIGPCLPSQRKSDETSSSDSEESREIGPRIPSNAIGPSLPPGFKSSGRTSTVIEGDNSDSDDDNNRGIGLRLPSDLSSNKDYSIGPNLPPSLKNSAAALVVTGRGDNSESDSDEGFMGPALPPGFKIQPSVIGPALPPGGKPIDSTGDYSDDESYNTVGPLPSEMDREGGSSNIAEEFEKRARNMKDKLTQPEDAPLVRDSWMTELPPEIGTNFGLSARQFRSKPSTKGEDRSGWTDTPQDKAQKEKDRASGKSKEDNSPKDPVLSARDRKIAEEVDRYNKNKRKESLLDMHEKERKKIKKEEAKSSEQEENVRRPFDRDQDLQVNRFDDAMRKSVIKKSQNLNTRFSHGSSSQFL